MSIPIFSLLIFFLLPVYAFALDCNSGCTGFNPANCSSLAEAEAACRAWAGSTDPPFKYGDCIQTGSTTWKVSQALYTWKAWATCTCPDGSLSYEEGSDCGGEGMCSSRQGESKAGIFQYSSDSNCVLQDSSCEVSCGQSEDLGNGYTITTGCTFTGEDATATAPQELCTLDAASGASPQDCSSGRVITVDWDETYTECVDTPLEYLEYFTDNCLNDTLQGALNGMGMGGMFQRGGSSGSGTHYRPSSVSIAGAIGAAFGGVAAGMACVFTDPTPQHNCTQERFVRTPYDCIPRVNDSLDSGIYVDPSTGQGIPCPPPLQPDYNTGVCVAPGYTMPTEQEMQQAMEQGITNPPRTEPCPVNTHEVNGICYRDIDGSIHDDGSQLPQDQPASQGGNAYHVWVDNFRDNAINFEDTERLLGEVKGVLLEMKSQGSINTAILGQQLDKLGDINDSLNQMESVARCGGTNQPKCTVEDVQANEKLDSIKQNLQQFLTSMSNLQDTITDMVDEDCTHQPWLMSGVFGGTLGLYECNVYDEGANEKLALIVSSMDAVKSDVAEIRTMQADFKQQNDDATLEAEASWQAYQQELSDQEEAEAAYAAESQAARSSVESKASADSAASPQSYASDWTFNIGQTSFSVPFSAWFLSILAISPVSLFDSIRDSCHFQYTFSAVISGVQASADVFPPDICEKFSVLREVLAWIFAVYTLGSIFQILTAALNESQRALLAALAAKAKKKESGPPRESGPPNV